MNHIKAAKNNNNLLKESTLQENKVVYTLTQNKKRPKMAITKQK